jgi:tetratricopeptide (TPR) repeat protein
VPAVQRPAPPLPAPLVAAPVESPQPATAVRTPAAAPRAGLPQREFAGVPGGSASGVFRPGGGREKQQQALDLAYQAWQADRLDDARHGYEQVLRSDARNADALLGLAAIAAPPGAAERAHDLYQQVLESDPNDVTAQAALINLRGQGDAGQSESRLKTLLASQPDSSAVCIVCAGQRLCPAGPLERGAAGLFQAYALEPDNADYLFNVAVSLDHLRQHKLAVQYYRMALSAAETRRGAFDRNAAGKRILELQP